MKFGILDYLSDSSIESDLLRAVGGVQCFNCHKEDQLPDDISDLSGAILWHRIKLSAATLARLTSCLVIVRAGVGYDNVDCARAGELGIPVVHIPDYGTNDVADHTLALLLAITRRLLCYDAALHEDPVAGWDPDLGKQVRRLTNKTLGIVGLGRIGSAVALRAKAFGLDVSFFDPYVPDGYDKVHQIRRYNSLPELVQRSDFLSLHVPLTDQTKRLIDRPLLAECKRGMTLINTARGGVVALDAVYDELLAGKLGAFAADVLESEPPDRQHPLIKAFVDREPALDGRLLFTPHAAFYAQESCEEIRIKAATQLLNAAQGLPLRNCVNSLYLKNARTPIER